MEVAYWLVNGLAASFAVNIALLMWFSRYVRRERDEAVRLAVGFIETIKGLQGTQSSLLGLVRDSARNSRINRVTLSGVVASLDRAERAISESQALTSDLKESLTQQIRTVREELRRDIDQLQRHSPATQFFNSQAEGGQTNQGGRVQGGQHT